jgi:hypothetical protein
MQYCIFVKILFPTIRSLDEPISFLTEKANHEGDGYILRRAFYLAPPLFHNLLHLPLGRIKGIADNCGQFIVNHSLDR